MHKINFKFYFVNGKNCTNKEPIKDEQRLNYCAIDIDTKTRPISYSNYYSFHSMYLHKFGKLVPQ